MAEPRRSEAERESAHAAAARGPHEPGSVVDPDAAERRPMTADNFSGSARAGVEAPRSDRGRRLLILAVAAVALLLGAFWLVPAFLDETNPIFGDDLITEPGSDVSIIGDGS